MGHLESVDGRRLTVAPDLGARLRRSEAFFDEFVRPPIDTYIARADIETPPGTVRRDPYEPPECTELDLRAEGISSVLWATGYRINHSWIDAPITDAQGIPRQHRGVSEIPRAVLPRAAVAAQSGFGHPVRTDHRRAIPRGAHGPGCLAGCRDRRPLGWPPSLSVSASPARWWFSSMAEWHPAGRPG